MLPSIPEPTVSSGHDSSNAPAWRGGEGSSGSGSSLELWERNLQLLHESAAAAASAGLHEASNSGAAAAVTGAATAAANAALSDVDSAAASPSLNGQDQGTVVIVISVFFCQSIFQSGDTFAKSCSFFPSNIPLTHVVGTFAFCDIIRSHLHFEVSPRPLSKAKNAINKSKCERLVENSFHPQLTHIVKLQNPFDLIIIIDGAFPLYLFRLQQLLLRLLTES